MFGRLTIAAVALLFTSAAAAQLSPAPSPSVTPAPNNQIQDVQPFPAPAPDLSQLSIEELEKMGDQQRARKEYLQAIDSFKAALKKKPPHKMVAVLQNKIGMAYIGMADKDKARKALKSAIKADKQYAEAYNNLGVVYYLDKKYGRAIKEYRRALALRETSASFHSNLGTVYLQNKDLERGIAEYRRAYELDPTIFDRSSQVGVAARMAAPEDRARFSYIVAKLYASSGDFDRALLALRRAMEDGYGEIDKVYKEPEFAKLREDQRFADLMASRPPAIPQ